MGFVSRLSGWMLLLSACAASALMLETKPLPPGSGPAPGESTATMQCTASTVGGDWGEKWNACTAQAVARGGGVVDVSGLTAASVPQTTSTFVQVGDAGGGVKAVSVTYLLPLKANWKFARLNDPKRCALTLYNRSAMVGQGVGGGGNETIFNTGGPNTLNALVCPDQTLGQNIYTRQAGWFALDDFVSKFTHGLIYAANLADQSRFERVTAVNNFGDAWWISNNCCGAVFENIHGYASGAGQTADHTAGGVPCTLTGNVGVRIADSTCNAPVNGKPNIVIRETNRGLLLENIYGEGNGWGDEKTAMVSIDGAEEGISFVGGGFYQDCRGTCAKPVFEAATATPWSVVGTFSGKGTMWIRDSSVNPVRVVASTGYGVQVPYFSKGINGHGY